MNDMERAATRIADAAWAEVQRSPFVQRQLDAPLTELPDLSIEAAERRAALGRSILTQLQALDLSQISHEIQLTLRLARFRAEIWAREGEWYWRVVDPFGIGMFGMFLPTAYCGGWMLSALHAQFGSFPFRAREDTDRYLALIDGYARMIDHFGERTKGQAERGMHMPLVQASQARTFLTKLKVGSESTLGVTDHRLVAIGASECTATVSRRIREKVWPAFDRALEVLSDDYLSRAPESVGLGQYPGGAEVYAELVRIHTTQRLTPDQVHARGHQRMTTIESKMKAIRDELGFKGDNGAFVKALDNDARWRADTVDAVKGVFQRYIDRMRARYGECFAEEPCATYGVAPLPPALESVMTYGYYDPPRIGQPEGTFMFNGRNLTRQALASLASLTFHELVPGHHLHFSTQQKLESLHPLHRYSFVNAFNEGWAEYAATLAGELGLYEAPEERFGRMLNDAFLTSRLVVDTGMNALGWTLERARCYLREHTGMSEAEIETDTIRYSCDIPGQALAYKLGDVKIIELREHMRSSLGARFDLKRFHSTVLGRGALPMPELEWQVDREIERCNASTQ